MNEPAGGPNARLRAVAAACAPFVEFYRGPLWARRQASTDPCDFVFGNPHDMALPGMVDALAAVTVPRDPSWFAYKFSEPEPRAAAAAALRGRIGVDVDPEHVLLTKGASGALAVVLSVLLEPGDEVVYVLPPWFFYSATIVAAGGVGVPVQCDPEDFDLDVEAIAAVIGPRTKAVIVNTPNNPTGRVYPPETLRRLAQALEEASARIGHRVYAISDEPYHRILFPGTTFTSPAAHYPHAFVLYSYAKTLLNPGQRLGFVAMAPGLAGADALGEAMFFAQLACGQGWPDATMQHALAALEGECIDLEQIRRRKDDLLGALRRAGYEVHDPQATFYLFPRSPIADDVKFAELLAERDVFVLPGEVLAMPGYFRISLTSNDEMVARSLDRFADAFAAVADYEVCRR
ncbi:MAG: aminotransferase class I/II-fold pyridoxal phosphate-dependent enzyme [Sporichthyaceae bacterium]